MSDSTINFIFFLFFFGITLFISGWRQMKRRRLIEETPTSKIRSLAMGLVEVKGSVTKVSALLSAPFSGRQCVFYDFLVQEYRRTKNSGYWHTIKKGSEKVPFMITDETGAVELDPTGAQVEVPYSYSFTSGIGKAAPNEVIASLERLGVKSKFWGINRNLRYLEHALTPQMSLYVLGTATSKPGVQSAKNEENILISKGKNIFYISDRPEKELLKKFGRGTWLSLFGGAGLIVAGVAVVVFSIVGG